MNRRQFLAGLLAIPLALSTPKIVDGGLELIAQAEAKETKYNIKEYYDSGIDTDVLPGARNCAQYYVTGKRIGFSNDEWFQYFFDNPKYSVVLQTMFKELEGVNIPINSPMHTGEQVTFNFVQFYNFNVEKKGQFNAVTFWEDGFMSFGKLTPYEHIVIPMDIEVIKKIEKL